MRKSILRFGALALMSMMSIGAFAQSKDTYIYLTNGTDNGDQAKGTYYVTKAATATEHGQVRLETAEGDAEGKYAFPNGYTPEGEQQSVLGTIVSEQHNYFDVVEIAANAFGTLPDPSTVEDVAPDAPITNTELIIPATVKKIGVKAFSWLGGTGCTITFEEGSKLVEIGANAFNADEGYTTAEPVEVPGGAAITINNPTLDLTLLDENNLGEGAFEGVNFSATGGATVKFGDITKIPANLFNGAKHIVTVEFANSGNDGTSGLSEIGYNAFAKVSDATDAKIAHFGYKDTSSGTPHYILPRRLNTIGSGAFQNALAPNAEFLFSDVNKGVITNVGSYAFDGCKVIDNTHFANLFEVHTLNYAAGSFKSCSLTGLLDLTDSPVKTIIPVDAFADNYAAGTSPAPSTGLTKVILPSNITEIGDDAFSGCQMLEECVLPEGLTTIGASAFSGCEKLNKCVLPEGLTTIGEGAFQNTPNYLTIDIPHTVTFVGQNAFNSTITEARTISIQSKEAVDMYSKSSVIKTTVTHAGAAPNITYTAHSPFGIDGGANTTLVVPMSVLKDYALAKNEDKGYNWHHANLTLKTYGTAFTNVATTPVYIYNGAFKYQVVEDWSPAYSEGWTVPQVKLAGVCTWKQQQNGSQTKDRNNFNASEYTDVISGDVLNLPQTVVKAGENNAEVNAYSFVYYELVGRPSVADDDDELDEGFTAVSPVDLKTTVKTVNIQANDLDLAGAFKGFTALEAVKFQAIETDNTTGWWGAKEKTPSTVTIGASAFEGCISLTSFTPSVSYTDKKVGASAFASCTELANVTIPAGVSEIGESAYSGTAISSVALPSDLTTIGASAFAGTNLTSINIPELVDSIGANAFDGYKEDSEFKGVLDVTVNWNTPKAVDANAFGEAVGFRNGNKFTYIQRHLYIPAGSGSNYEAVELLPSAQDYNPFKDATMFQLAEAITAKKDADDVGRLDIVFDENSERTLTIDETEFEDDGIYEFNIPTAANDVKVTYIRDVKDSKNMANPLFVPFSFKGKGEGYQIYKVFDTKVMKDNNGEDVEGIEYVKLAEDEYTLPNVPYVFIPTQDEITFEAQGYAATSAPGTPIVTCSNAANDFAFYGTYKNTSDEALSNNDFYALSSSDRFVKLTWRETGPGEAAKKESVKALRFYMTINPKGNNPYAPSNVKVIILDEDEATAIKNVNAETLNAPMFDLMGRQIATPAKGQVYIQNGVKKLAK